ncbi:hypothetical protein [Rhizobium mongolense]|uniref:Uncharacterized protein n=2 Tax=Rhizobium mongolense TaxID=57676 RepID=A0ABR6IW75_9HYPH|nr:hypothetical protein [Rhizobium mongolense]MBB4232166.1 hypothetical protein [Rhizobium mongolense]TVZ63112.1 hypothetical protein BCL32_3230 [Rhizobium mongolense USDA 1844]
MENSKSDEQYLFFSSDILRKLHANNLSPADVLKKAGVHDLKAVSDPAVKAGHRDVMSILIGSSIAVAAATPLITRVLATLINKPVIVYKRELKPALDGRGEVIRDNDGQPIFVWSEASTADRGPGDPKMATKTTITRNGVELSVSES